ncbi:hypothetical protein SK128_016123, partial [Halocaridina rubra]
TLVLSCFRLCCVSRSESHFSRIEEDSSDGGTSPTILYTDVITTYHRPLPTYSSSSLGPSANYHLIQCSTDIHPPHYYRDDDRPPPYNEI